MNTNTLLNTLLLAIFITANSVVAQNQAKAVRYQTIEINDTDIFYREAGSRENPTILLLHGFPTSSHMFRNLIEDLKDEYHLVAPDYPGFGNSEQPPMDAFDYSFDNYAKLIIEFTEALNLDFYSLYLMDYGAPVGFRVATAHPERVETLIVQNGNAYEEGLLEFWDPIRTYWDDPSPENAEPLRFFYSPEGLKWQYTHGTRNPSVISPDNWNNDLQHLAREENEAIQLKLFYDYGTNPPKYPEWQAYLREHQPPTIVVWGKNDYIFPDSGAYPYLRDLEQIDFHLLNTGHFALEEDGELIADLIAEFISRYVQ